MSYCAIFRVWYEGRRTGAYHRTKVAVMCDTRFHNSMVQMQKNVFPRAIWSYFSRSELIFYFQVKIHRESHLGHANELFFWSEPKTRFQRAQRDSLSHNFPFFNPISYIIFPSFVSFAIPTQWCWPNIVSLYVAHRSVRCSASPFSGWCRCCFHLGKHLAAGIEYLRSLFILMRTDGRCHRLSTELSINFY